MSAPVCIVQGVGPLAGLGASLCQRFAREGMHVIVAGRTRERLAAVVAAIEADGGAASAVRADATSEADTISLFDAAAARGPIACAIYNAGNNTPGRIVEMEADYFEQSWRLSGLGGFLFGREAVRRWLDAGEDSDAPRTLLFTGASASLRGRPNFGAFNAAKGALRNLAQAMAKEYGAEGIHVAHVVVDGGIAGDKIIKGVPQFVDRVGEDGLIGLDGLADAYWFLHRQPRSAWSFELDLRTFKERW
ncbi:MAG: SDR family NAD(P)-dependent oxidoreductase [Pseudomonadales bacterium]|jgi:NAD(P)-dependent dehydrogenase (short-subunit alcohol dehydrogenase family)|nr:SDR family NAD(P)-dependent oxidoreductase [Pseudomonadales bacterium]